MEAWQGIFISRRSIFAIEPGLIPILGMTWKLSIRENSISSPLNRDPSKFLAGPVSEFILAVQIKILSEEFNTGFFLKVYFTEDLEIADI